MIEKIILKKSAVENKMPATEQLEYGEIALNFNAMNPFISFKDTADGIRQIRDYSNEIQNINGSLTDAKNEINALRTDIDKNTQEITKCLKITDFNAFKEDNTNTFDAFALEVAKVLETKAEKTELNAYAKLTDATQTILANKLKADDLILEGFSLNDQINVINNNINRNTDYISNVELQKVNKTDIAQTTGTSTTSVMSQKASTTAFAANTPSGDPMHYLYELVGGVYNGTASDVVVSDPIVGNLTHKAGCWWCTGLGDLTNDDMRKVYAFGCNIMNNVYANAKRCYNYCMFRTTCTDSQSRYNEGYVHNGFDISFLFCFSIYLKVIKFSNEELPINNIDYAFYECVSLRYIHPVLNVKYCNSFVGTFIRCVNLTDVKIKYLHSNIDFKYSTPLNTESIIYMIENATDATFTIILHPEAYERAIADTGVQAALANKTNVSLAKGE